jgi:N-acetylmuramate 1-kinase
MTAYTDQDIIDISRKALGVPENLSGHLIPIVKGGSDRSYYRVYIGHKTAVFVHYNPERQENNYYVPISQFLEKIGIRVPGIVLHNPKSRFVVMEDLGNEDLWSYRHASWDIRRPFYYGTLEMVSRLHLYPPEEFIKQRVPVMDGFDLGLYRWEQDYFRDNCLVGLCRLELKGALAKELEEELEVLSKRLQRQGLQLIHRDLQSQNVMICKNEPVLIDFQGMRFGNRFYDLGSLLYDPYVELADEERLQLLSYYYRLSPQQLAWEQFKDSFYEASIQRLMQALGAYGFLGLKQGRTAFLEYVPSGLSHLLSVLNKINIFPVLKDIAQQCSEISKNT